MRTFRNRLAAVAALGVALAGTACMPMRSGPPGPSFLVFYTPFSANIDPEASHIISEAANAAKAEPTRVVFVLSYADQLGSTEANRTLTRLRAQVVRDTLVADGVASSRIILQPKGAQGGDPGVESRRVEIELR
jgi:outer membrane protein OmpA-like peptidoglycan-associated protein